MSSTSRLPILIMSAGISSLALAPGLCRASIPFLIFERDPALNIRSLGYRVRISSSAIAALTSVLPDPLFSCLEASCAMLIPNQKHHMFNAVTGETLSSPMPPQKPDETIVADRTALRSVLMIGLKGFMEFGKEFMEYENCEKGVKVTFSDGSEMMGSLLFGVGGSRSRVRKRFLPHRQYLDTEGRMFYGKTPISEDWTSRFQAAKLEGMLLIQDRTHDVPLILFLVPMRFEDNEFCSSLLNVRQEIPKLPAANHMEGRANTKGTANQDRGIG